MNRVKKICVVSGSRAEYDLLYPLIDEIERESSIKLDIVVTGSHLSNEFGATYKTIEEDGFIISRKVEVLVSSNSQLTISLDGDMNKYTRVYKDVSVSKSLGIGIIGFSEAYSDLKPDLIVLLGDRFEIFAAASAATVQKIPIAHIHGGEVTKGSFDESFRHSITKMSHIHFTSIEEYRNRVIQLGEDPDSVFSFGAIGLDNIKKNLLLSRTDFEKNIRFKLNKKNLLISFHEATLEKESTKIQFQNLLDALEKLKDTHFIFTKSNADPAGKMINKMMKKYVSSAGIPNLAGVIHRALIAPSFFDKLFQIDFRLPVEEEFGFGIVEPSALVLRFDVNRGKSLGFHQVFGYLAVVDRFVHADVEQLLAGLGVIDRKKNCRNQIFHVHEISPDRLSLGVKHHRDCLRSLVARGLFRGNKVTPYRSSEDFLAEREGILEIVLLHDPRGP